MKKVNTMREETGVIRRLPLFAVLGIMLAAIAVSGCGHQTDHKVAPQSPFIEITGGPTEGSRDEYTARIFWSGWDNDGIISHYEYALDPPVEFSPDEIAAPEKAPGISMSIIPGPAVNADTLVVSKTVDGKLLTFRWIETLEFSRSFAFKTPLADTSFPGGTPRPDSTFHGAHRVYVRCQDNDKLYSEAKTVGFTATTITPSATISRPKIQSDILNLGATLTISWGGIDPDSPDPNKRPTGYLYRLLRLDTLSPPIPLPLSQPQNLFNKGAPVVWKYQRADTTQITLRLAVGGTYIFGVRAVDLAGGIEPFLNAGRNFFKFQAFAIGGYPELTISEPAFGSFSYTALGAPTEVQVPTGAPLRFQWEASAEIYGGEVEAYSWGLDIPDLEREGPDSGWSGWGDVKISTPIIFTRPGIHVLYVRARDISGSITIGSIIMDVVEFSFDREVLWVDDSYDNQFPTDSQHDAFWRARFQSYFDTHPDYPGPLFEHSSHGLNDREILSPRVPTLEDMGRYKLIVWENFGSGYNAESGLIKVTAIHPTMGSYLVAGGKLWVGGRMSVPPMLKSPNGVRADLSYPIDDQRLFPGTFAWDFIKLRTTKINNPQADVDPKNLLWGVAPYAFTDTTKVAPYDSMTINPSKLRSPYQLAAPYCDAIFDPIFGESDPTFKGDIDSLYTYRAYGPEKQGRSSTFQRRLNAIRWHDDDPSPLHGPIQWFGFPLYYMIDSQAQETFNRSIDWFRSKGR